MFTFSLGDSSAKEKLQPQLRRPTVAKVPSTGSHNLFDSGLGWPEAPAKSKGTRLAKVRPHGRGGGAEELFDLLQSNCAIASLLCTTNLEGRRGEDGAGRPRIQPPFRGRH